MEILAVEGQTGGPLNLLIVNLFLVRALIHNFLSCLPANRMLLNFLLSIQTPDVFALCELQISFIRFRALAHAAADVARLPVFTILDVILLAVDLFQFLHVHYLSVSDVLAIVALFVF